MNNFSFNTETGFLSLHSISFNPLNSNVITINPESIPGSMTSETSEPIQIQIPNFQTEPQQTLLPDPNTMDIDNNQVTQNNHHDQGQGYTYKCPQCPQQFPSELNREKHMEEAHTFPMPSFVSFDCNLCPVKFQTRPELVKHNCPELAKVLPSVKQSISSGGGIVLECPICGKNSPTKFNFNKHIGVHQGIQRESKENCPLCHKRFLSVAGLHLHMNTYEKPKTETLPGAAAISNVEPNKPFSCNVDGCSRKFALQMNLQRHLTFHGIQKPEQGFACLECEVRFKTEKRLQEHQQNHNKKSVTAQPIPILNKVGEGPAPVKKAIKKKKKSKVEAALEIDGSLFSCIPCNRVFKKKFHLDLHLKSSPIHKTSVVEVKDPNAPFPCPSCDKSYTKKYRLDRHIRSQHQVQEEQHEEFSNFSNQNHHQVQNQVQNQVEVEPKVLIVETVTNNNNTRDADQIHLELLKEFEVVQNSLESLNSVGEVEGEDNNLNTDKPEYFQLVGMDPNQSDIDMIEGLNYSTLLGIDFQ